MYTRDSENPSTRHQPVTEVFPVVSVEVGMAPGGWAVPAPRVESGVEREVFQKVKAYASAFRETLSAQNLSVILANIEHSSGSDLSKLITLVRANGKEIERLLREIDCERKPLEGFALEQAILRNFETVSRFDFGVKL